MMSTSGVYNGSDHSHRPHALLYKEEARNSLSTSLSAQLYLQCPLNKVPRCFRTVLIRSLELGESNFIPTNWRGFSDYFRLQELKARSAEELIETWADRHPCKQEHTLQKVIEYARSTRHAKLIHQLDQTLKEHLRPTQEWTADPADCFKTCSFCVPLRRSDSKSPDDIHSLRTDDSNSQAGLDHHMLRRTHSLPKDIQIAPKCQSRCSGTCTPCTHMGSSVTNIFMSCTCRRSLFRPSGMSPPTPLSYFFKSPTATTPLTTTTTTASATTTTHSNEGGCHASCTEHIQSSPVFEPAKASMERVVSKSLDRNSPSSEEHHTLMQARRRRHVSDSCCLQVDENTLEKPTPVKPKRALEKLRMSVSDSQIRYWRQEHAISPSMESPQHIGKEIKEHEAQGQGETELGEVVKEKQTSERTDVMQEFGHQLFDTAPYNCVQRFYNSSSREAIILVLACFFLYNGFRCILQTMCEDGGFRKVFTNRDNVLAESARKIVMFSIHILCVIITPLCLCLHISSIASKPWIPKTSFSGEEAVERMMNVHRNFSPYYEVRLVQNSPKSVFQMSGTMTKRHINSIWISLLNSLLFPALLYYIGAVNLSTKNFTEGGVCQFVTVSIIHVPLLDDNIHLFKILDFLLTLGVMVCVQTLKDYYYYENRIAVFAVTVGGEAESLYQEIRRRWVLLDFYCYLTAIAIMIGSITLACVKKTIIPDPSVMLAPEHLLNLCFWILVLSVVLCLGMSSNRLVKKTSLPAYILVMILINVVNLHIDTIPPEAIIIFYLVAASDFILSLLISLCHCHYYHYQHTRNQTSQFFLFLSLSLMVLLPLTVLGTLYREVVHLSAFVQW